MSIIFIILSSIIYITAIFLFAQGNQSGDPVAVLDLEATGVTESEAKTLTDKLRGELINTGKFKVIERSQMEQILKEQGFQQTGCTSSDCAVEMGQLLGVKNIITGSIGKVGQTFLISVRIIHVGTGEITKIVDEDMQGKIDVLLTKGMKNVALKLVGEGEQEDVEYEEEITAEEKPMPKRDVKRPPPPPKGKPIPLLKLADLAFNRKDYAKAENLYRRYLNSKTPKKNKCYALYKLGITCKLLKKPHAVKLIHNRIVKECPKNIYREKAKRLLKGK